MSRLRLDLIHRTYDEGDRYTWRLWSGSRVVSSSGPQLYSRRIDCARGAEVGTGVSGVVSAVKGPPAGMWADRWAWEVDRCLPEDVEVRLIDERGEGSAL